MIARVFGASALFSLTMMMSSSGLAASCGGYCEGSTYHFCYENPRTGDMSWREYPGSPHCAEQQGSLVQFGTEAAEPFSGTRCGPPTI